MKKELLLSFILIFFHTILSAQTGSDTTIFIPEVELEGTKATQSPGMVIIKVDSVAQVIHQHNTIAELLSQHSGLNIRNYGSGLLSTINSRGLGANHTSVSWNGIPLNSANLGLTDLSLLPVFFFDDVAIVSGGT
ncbi:MAG: TonB-dependent receptor, partial [Bacteroidia bacterium]